ncbi:MAG: TetR/AcrR family transcriptional regulator [Deltaproteobacteria bacterium]|nr:TetR/AcrR family transcriptional regulator [Deltaproteobacteria bacterium]
MTTPRKTLGLRRSPKADERKATIKLAAIKAFSTRGYEQTTLDELATAAGVSKALLYWHWKNKGALLTELVDECMVQYENLLARAVASDAPYAEKLMRLFSDALDLLERNTELNQLVHFCSLHSSHKTEERFSEQVEQHYREIVRLLRALLREGIDSGHFRDSLDPAALAQAALCLVEGHIYLSILGAAPPLRKMVDQLQLLLLPHPI